MDSNSLVNLVPTTGHISNSALMAASNMSKEDYMVALGAAKAAGLLKMGPGRGGTVRRVVAENGVLTQAVAQAASAEVCAAPQASEPSMEQGLSAVMAAAAA